MRPDGTAIFCSAEGNGLPGTRYVRARNYNPANDTWSSSSDLVNSSMGYVVHSANYSLDGSAMCAWNLAGGGPYTISRYSGGSWDGGKGTGAGTGPYPGYLSLAMDSNGNAAAVYASFSVTPLEHTNAVVSIFKKQNLTWEAQDIIDDGATNSYAMYPQVMLDESGRITAVYMKNGHVFSRQRTLSTSWGATAQTIETYASNLDFLSPLRMNSNGDAVLTFKAADKSTIYAARYAGGVWQPMEDIDPNVLDATGGQVDINPYGMIFAIWNRSQSGVNKGIFGAFYK
jgi:hypothetical protein